MSAPIADQVITLAEAEACLNLHLAALAALESAPPPDSNLRPPAVTATAEVEARADRWRKRVVELGGGS